MINNERLLFLNHLAQTSKNPVLLQVHDANGIYVSDNNGKKYIDLISGVSVSVLGHKNPEIIKAVKEQADKYMHLMVYGEYIQSPQVQFAKLLCSLLPSSLNQVYLVSSGSEAMEGALKLAKKFTGRTEIISMINAYHGSTHGTLSIMGNETLKNPFRPLLPDVRFIKFNYWPDIDKITEKTACVTVEPIQGEAGINNPEPGYLQQLRNRCDQTGTVLIFDEVQTGFGRTGSLFAFQHYQVVPDILVIAKAMGGGLPLGGFIASVEMMQCLAEDPALGHITTFGGHPLSCAAAIASLTQLTRENYIRDVPQKEELFRMMLIHRNIKTIRGIGLLLAVEIASEIDIAGFREKCLKHGILTDWFLFCDNSFRISPPLTITLDEISLCCKLLLNALDEY
ncbi:MAG: aspartate aminotransferase family protein [Bacteroidia bacterium]|nr:aspartate aminotransferase family protein [Bacteroidia bacterium]